MSVPQCSEMSTKRKCCTRLFYCHIYHCFAFNSSTNFYMHSSGLFQTNLCMHKFYAHETTFAST